MHPALGQFILKRTPKYIFNLSNNNYEEQDSNDNNKMAGPAPETGLPLNTGATIPALGLGTWQSQPGEVEKAVVHALEKGYRHIDCAFMYQNENEVGAGIKEAISKGICKREDIFVTTKLWCTYHTREMEGLDASLKNLGLDYVDLFLMHWPVPMNPKGNHPLLPKHPDGSRDINHSHSWIDTYKNLEKLPTSKAKAVGVCNMSVENLERLLSSGITKVPAANQIENHPYCPQQEIVDFCKSKGIHITAYSPLGSTGSPLFKEEAIIKVAQKHSVGPGSVLLSYHVARGSSVLAKSVTPSRIEENRKLVSLDADDMTALENIHKEKGIHRYVYPAFGVNLGFPDKQAEGGMKL